MKEIKSYSKNIISTNLHIIGHGIGVAISKEVAQLLNKERNEKFWKILKITGIDPIRPCFEYIDAGLSRAEYSIEITDLVDIIYSQIPEEEEINNLYSFNQKSND